MLYHYTTAEGLLGILRDGLVYASDLSHANDPSEAHYANALLLAALDRAIEGEAAIERRRILRYVREYSGTLSREASTYAFCLSEVRDQLGQWRAYSNMGLGYCIGFDTSAMRPGSPEDAPSPYFHLERATYSREEQERRIDRVIPAVLAAVEAMGRSNPIALSLFLAAAQTALVTFKNPAFAEEREWRAIAMGPLVKEYGNVGFRAVGGHIVPYEPLNLWGGGQRSATHALPIVSITAGPRSDPTRAMASVRGLLMKHGYPPTVVVERSGVPLR